MKLGNMSDILCDKCNRELDNLHNLNTKHKKTDIQTNKLFTCVKGGRKNYKLSYLNYDLIMDNPIKQYIRDFNIDTLTDVTHVDTTIHITLLHMKISQIKNQRHQTFYTKDY